MAKTTTGPSAPQKPASELEIIALNRLERAGLPTPVLGYRFDRTRRWKFDAAWPGQWVALEVEGGVWNRGRHVTGKGYSADLEKYNAAALAGWLVIRATREQVESGAMVEWVRRALEAA